MKNDKKDKRYQLLKLLGICNNRVYTKNGWQFIVSVYLFLFI